MSRPKTGNIYMLLILAFQFIGIIALTVAYQATDGSLSIVWQLILSQAVSFLLPFIIYKICTKEKVFEILSLKSITFVNMLYIVMLCVLIQPVMMLVSALSANIFGNQTDIIFDQLGEFSYGTFLLTMAVTPAILEEITFRGVIFHNYRNVNFKKAAVVNGLFFGLMHTNLHQFFYAFLLGIIFALFVHYTGSILASVLAHFTINASQVTLVKLFEVIQERYDTYGDMAQSAIQETEAELSMAEALLSQLFILLIFGGGFLLLFRQFKKYNEKRQPLSAPRDLTTVFTQPDHSRLEDIWADSALPPEIPEEKKGSIHLPTFIIVVVLYTLVTIAYTFL